MLLKLLLLVVMGGLLILLDSLEVVLKLLARPAIGVLVLETVAVYIFELVKKSSFLSMCILSCSYSYQTRSWRSTISFICAPTWSIKFSFRAIEWLNCSLRF